MIVANSDGFYINDSGLINISNFTATTGKINLVDGQYVGVDTRDGSIVIGPSGFNGSSADYVNLISRVISSQGQVTSGGQLNVITGTNNVSKDNDITKINTGTTSPNVSIDAQQFGSFYAGSVKLISTESGVGVNSSSFIIANSGKLEITADGQINVNKVQGKDINIKGTRYWMGYTLVDTKDKEIVLY